MARDRAKFRAIATEFVTSIEKTTVCSRCGAVPIEWHHPEHPQKPNSRVSSLRTQGASVERIKKEIERCEPLCRSCHMKEDGRLEQLHANKPYQPGQIYVGKKPCSNCGRLAKPLRRGRCYTCYIKFMGIR